MLDSVQWSCYSDFYRKSEYARFPQEHRRSVGQLGFSMIRVEQAEHEFADPAVPETAIALPLSVSQGCRYCWNMGGEWRHEMAEPGRVLVLVLPADRASRWWVTGDRELLLLVVLSKTVRQVCGAFRSGGVFDSVSTLSAGTWQDRFVQASIICLWDSLNGRCRTLGILCDGALSGGSSLLLSASANPVQARSIASSPGD
ncbi:hypothetical protein ACIU0H_14155 [Pseudomonas aeruginosa]